MKARFAIAGLLGLLLCGFTLYNVEVQTPRVRWEVDYRGAAYNTATPEETNLRHCFNAAGYTDAFGHTYFRTAGMQCSWAAAGTGGTVGVVVKIVHEDAGIDCQCTLGACTATASTEMGCTCADGGYGGTGGVQLGKTVMPDGGEQNTTRLCVQLDDSTDCSANPSGLSCSIDLFR